MADGGLCWSATSCDKVLDLLEQLVAAGNCGTQLLPGDACFERLILVEGGELPVLFFTT